MDLLKYAARTSRSWSRVGFSAFESSALSRWCRLRVVTVGRLCLWSPATDPALLAAMSKRMHNAEKLLSCNFRMEVLPNCHKLDCLMACDWRGQTSRVQGLFGVAARNLCLDIQFGHSTAFRGLISKIEPHLIIFEIKKLDHSVICQRHALVYQTSHILLRVSLSALNTILPIPAKKVVYKT